LRNKKDGTIYNAKPNENIVFRKGTPRLLRKLNGNILSLLTGGGGNNNYWHWLYDVLPRLALYSKHSDLEKIDYFLFPSILKEFQQETLNCLNIPHFSVFLGRKNAAKQMHNKHKQNPKGPSKSTNSKYTVCGNGRNNVF